MTVLKLQSAAGMPNPIGAVITAMKDEERRGAKGLLVVPNSGHDPRGEQSRTSA